MSPAAIEPAAAAGMPVWAGWRCLRGKKTAAVAVSLATLLVSLALLVPVLPLQDPLAPDYNSSLSPPSTAHWLGTDLHGRDLLSRVLWASRTSLAVGVIATGLALAAGIAAGGVAGYGGRLADNVMMRLADVFLSFPIVLGAIAIMVIFGQGRRNVFLAIALFGWPVFARIFRSSVLSVRERGYVKAARVMGVSSARNFFVHVFPNSAGPLVSYASMMVAGAITAEAGLSFINLGVQPPDASWGLMLQDAMGQFEQSPWLLLAPGLALTLTVLTFILLGIAAGGMLNRGKS
ncbi:MAG: ABC transporter permease [Thermoleophilia bacterium]